MKIGKFSELRARMPKEAQECSKALTEKLLNEMRDGTPRNYSVIVQHTEIGFSAHTLDVNGCVATGVSELDTLMDLQDSLQLHLDSLKKAGQPIPEPCSSVDYVEITQEQPRGQEQAHKAATRYAIIIERYATGYGAYVPDLPGCGATGTTEEEVRQNIQTAISTHLRSMREDGDHISEPTTMVQYVEVTTPNPPEESPRLKQLKRVQEELRKYIPPGSDLVGELIRDRSEEVAREDEQANEQQEAVHNFLRKRNKPTSEKQQ